MRLDDLAHVAQSAARDGRRFSVAGTQYMRVMLTVLAHMPECVAADADDALWFEVSGESCWNTRQLLLVMRAVSAERAVADGHDWFSCLKVRHLGPVVEVMAKTCGS